MTISKDNVKTRKEFLYENDDTNLNFYVIFSHTEEMGPTVSLSQDNITYSDFPAEMFGDIADFLRSERLLKGGQSPVVPNIPGIVKSQVQPQTSGLQVTKINKKGPKNPLTDEVDIDTNGKPVQSFAAPVEDKKKVGRPPKKQEEIKAESEPSGTDIEIKAETNDVAQVEEIIQRPVKKSTDVIPINEQKVIKPKHFDE